jgi:hypothetical protein
MLEGCDELSIDNRRVARFGRDFSGRERVYDDEIEIRIYIGGK